MPNADQELSITIEGTTYRIDDFELGELEWVEDQLGMAIDEATPMKQAVAFVAVVKRRENPDYSFDDARKIKLRMLDEPARNGNGAKKRPTKGRAASVPASSGESS